MFIVVAFIGGALILVNAVSANAVLHALSDTAERGGPLQQPYQVCLARTLSAAPLFAFFVSGCKLSC